ncbi:MAG TPA: helix-turn-helix transcriptional regulator, partial [Ktedonobacteraceae bacterium]
MSQKLRYERKLRGWSQADVAAKIGSDTKAISRWERGEALPRPYFIQKLVELFGKDANELGLMEIAQERTIVSSDNFTAASPSEQAVAHENKEFSLIVPQDNVRQEYWGEAPHIENFYGRENELTEVEQWIAEGCCRVVAVVGIGGVGKTSFALVVAKKVQAAFKYVFWRSLRNSPKVEHILESFFQIFPEQRSSDLPINIEEKISLLITLLREHRCLLILDNVESVLQAEDRTGEYREESKDYGRLFQRIGETYHASCLLLTSREKPKEVAYMEGASSTVRSLHLSGIDDANGRILLKDKELLGSDEIWTTFIHLYSGNPLILKIVSEPIREVFGGDIADFLREEKAVFGGTRELLDQQFHRLSKLEQHLMYWLAIEREAVSRQDLWQNMLHPSSKGALLDAMSSLRRRSLIETGSDGRFTLQPVIMEYVTERFVENIYQEIDAESIILLGSHALIKAQSNDYVRESQLRFILAPLAAKLLATFGKAGCNQKLRYVLSTLRITSSQMSSYAAGNILNLLIQLQIDLRGFNFSFLAVEQ